MTDPTGNERTEDERVDRPADGPDAGGAEEDEGTSLDEPEESGAEAKPAGDRPPARDKHPEDTNTTADERARVVEPGGNEPSPRA